MPQSRNGPFLPVTLSFSLRLRVKKRGKHERDTSTPMDDDTKLHERIPSLRVFQIHFPHTIRLDRRRLPAAGYFFFFAAAVLSARAFCLCWSALLTFACFCEDFFWLDFGDLSPMVLLVLRVDFPAAGWFSAGNLKADAAAGVVGDAGGLICLRKSPFATQSVTGHGKPCLVRRSTLVSFSRIAWLCICRRHGGRGDRERDGGARAVV